MKETRSWVGILPCALGLLIAARFTYLLCILWNSNRPRGMVWYFAIMYSLSAALFLFGLWMLRRRPAPAAGTPSRSPDWAMVELRQVLLAVVWLSVSFAIGAFSLKFPYSPGLALTIQLVAITCGFVGVGAAFKHRLAGLAMGLAAAEVYFLVWYFTVYLYL